MRSAEITEKTADAEASGESRTVKNSVTKGEISSAAAGAAKAKWCIVSRPQPSLFFRMITLVMRAGSDVNTQQVIELVQRTIGFAVQDATEIAAGLASCKELIIPNLIDSAAIALADAASKAGVQCDLEPIIESEIERDLFEAERPTEKGRRRKSAQRSRI